MDLSRFIDKAIHYRVLGLKISQQGKLIAEWHFEPEARRNIYSASKSFTSAAVGFAVQEGLLSLDEPLTEAFKEDMPKLIGPNLSKAKVRDLLTMCLGQKQMALASTERPLYKEDDWVKMSLAIPFDYAPGTHFVYNNVGPYLAGVLVQRRAQCNLVAYLTPRLFAPLGIKRPTWEEDRQGLNFGAGGLMLTLSELHRFGQFYLNEGEWDGKQLLSKQWIRDSSAPADVDFYGYLFWRGKYNSYRADGKFSQISMILPEKGAVITFVSECRDGEGLLNAVYDELCPQL